MNGWEYKIVHVRADGWSSTGLPADLNEQFDRLGGEGWELVGTEALIRPALFRGAGHTVGIIAFFKRGLPGRGE